MKQLLSFSLAVALLLATASPSSAQQTAHAKNLIIIVMDGYRWHELFEGADSAILFNKRFNYIDSAWTVEKYWAPTAEERRRKLMPFTWDVIARNGRLLGNRNLGNNVNVINTYWFSYPGRSEIFTGYFDSTINSNEYPDNPNTNVLEFINSQPGYQGKVAAFASWDAVARIINRNRNHIPVNIYGEDVPGPQLTPLQKEANALQHTLPDIFGKGERMDAGTYPLAKSYLLAKHPKVLYIDLGDNDDFAHGGQYGLYLDAAHAADRMFNDLWTTIQSDPFYRDQTDLLVFPDHGRGLGDEWTSHGTKIQHSDETYFLSMGPGIPATGEVKATGQIYQQQYAQTIASLLGLHFTANHPVAEAVR